MVVLYGGMTHTIIMKQIKTVDKPIIEFVSFYHLGLRRIRVL